MVQISGGRALRNGSSSPSYALNQTIRYRPSSAEMRTVSNAPRVAIDDLNWTCFSTLATDETKKDKSQFMIYPNPVRNNELFVKGENLNKVSKADIYDLSGKLIETIINPFKNTNKINLKGLTKGTYILKTDNFSTKFIVD